MQCDEAAYVFILLNVSKQILERLLGSLLITGPQICWLFLCGSFLTHLNLMSINNISHVLPDECFEGISREQLNISDVKFGIDTLVSRCAASQVARKEEEA
ncbi:hypothetical protein AV530_013934 [Patagioenas fasciata monilis]|uniref:Uncharacterized protein n=1 Tax=Patagioenas fasciata monilis TaxID=372326 RepID=A0A1V4KMY7_PATFA|nr:hypothetical protein AV530_013934 [Patagioenas fasciata monilis]